MSCERAQGVVGLAISMLHVHGLSRKTRARLAGASGQTRFRWRGNTPSLSHASFLFTSTAHPLSTLSHIHEHPASWKDIRTSVACEDEFLGDGFGLKQAASKLLTARSASQSRRAVPWTTSDSATGDARLHLSHSVDQRSREPVDALCIFSLAQFAWRTQPRSTRNLPHQAPELETTRSRCFGPNRH